MTIQERLATDPLGAFCGCFVWIPIAVWVVSLIHWTISGDLDFIFALLGAGCAVGLGVLALNPPVAGLSPLILAGTIATTMLFPFARSAMNRAALAAIDVEQLNKYFDSLLARPNNPSLLIRIAEMLFVRGFPVNAVAIGEVALQGLPQSMFRAEHQMVSAWKMQVRAGQRAATRCLRCGFDNDPSEVFCQRCHAPYIVELARGKWLGKLSAQKLIAIWAGLLIAFVGIPASVQFSHLNPTLALMAIMGQLVVGLLLIVFTFVRRES